MANPELGGWQGHQDYPARSFVSGYGARLPPSAEYDAGAGSGFLQAHPSQIVIADSDDAILRFVSATRGAVGIVDLYSLTKECHRH